MNGEGDVLFADGQFAIDAGTLEMESVVLPATAQAKRAVEFLRQMLGGCPGFWHAFGVFSGKDNVVHGEFGFNV